MVKIVYFVHGTTKDNELKQAAGWNDVELSETGISQTLKVGELVNTDDIDIVISSDLTRAYESAKNIFGDKVEILKDARIRECNYGILNGSNKNLVKYVEHIDIPFEDGESLKDVEKRMRDFCDYLASEFDGKTVALVSHRAPQLALQVILYNKTWLEAIESDWRKTGDWQPGWEYELK